MSEKGGGDLDIFNSLSKGSSATSDSVPPPPPPQKTLLGLQAPPGGFPAPRTTGRPPPSRTSIAPPSRPGGSVPGRSLPPPPPSRLSGAPPPPPSLGPPRPLNPPTSPPGATSAAKPGGPSVDMDWDDEDEQTTIYDRGGESEGTQSLLEGSLPPPPPPPAAGRVASLPPPLASRPSTSLPPPPPFPRSGPSIAPPPRLPAPLPTRPMSQVPVPPAPFGAAAAPGLPTVPAPAFRRRSVSGVTVGAIVVAVVGAAVAIFLLWAPRTGALVITVSGPGNKPLDAVEILVNGEKKCASSPCTIDGLKPDTYYVRAHAAGYQGMADIAVPVSSGAKAVQNLSLVRALGTGIKVIGEGAGLKLYVDDREVGPLPQEIKDMEPGDHAIKVAGSERFEPFEKRITVEPEQMQTIGPLKLRVLKGLATIQPGPGSDGAKVILISGADRRTLPKLPITLDIPTNQPHTLVATRHGYEQLKLPIKFEDGEVERTFEVTLVETGTPSPSGGGGGAVAVSAPRTTPPPTHETYTPPKPQDTSSSVASNPSNTSTASAGGGGGGGAILNINSIPMSNILLDGRPVGTTPKLGVHVSAGSHVVTFVNGSDRKASSVTVSAGDKKTVAVRF